MLQTAVIAKRTEDEPPATEEIRELTEAAGARVCGEITQQRPPNPGTNLGPGAVESLTAQVESTGADTVVFDGTLSPQQTVTVEETVGAHVVDRSRLILELFARQAQTRRAQLQVELARLKYRLPRVRARADEGILNRQTETGTPYYDLQDRIDELKRKLAELPSVAEQHRQQRREDGYDLVALAGYTNAGKSTLLRRLADDLTVDEETHDDLAVSAAVEDRLFKTLETTTRRATFNGRDVLVTDTVGFLDDLPHWFVESFHSTLTAVSDADVVIVVADVAQPTAELRRKLNTVHETLGDDHPPVVTALNKSDRLCSDTIAEKQAVVAGLAPNPVIISAQENEGIAELRGEVCELLSPLIDEEFVMPVTDDALSHLSWLYDEAVSVAVTYDEGSAHVAVTAKPAVLDRARARLNAVTE